MDVYSGHLKEKLDFSVKENFELQKKMDILINENTILNDKQRNEIQSLNDALTV